MRDALLFGGLPYAAVTLLLLVPIARSLAVSPSAASAPGAAVRAPWAWRYGLALLVTGHLGGFLLPREVAALERLPGGVLLIEVAAFLVGMLAALGLFAQLRSARGSGHGSRPPGSAADALLSTMLAIAVTSGLATALAYRWGSSWYAVTIVPYLRSLLRLQPEVELVGELPPLVRLHVLSGIVATAVLPFTRWGAVPARAVARLRAWLAQTPSPVRPVQPPAAPR